MKKLLLFLILIILCSCNNFHMIDDFHSSDGNKVVQVIDSDDNNELNCKYMVRVKSTVKFRGRNSNFWLLTDSLYKVGDIIQIK